MADDTTALSLDPEYSWAYYDRGLASFRTGKYDAALSDYKKAVKLNSKGAADAYQEFAKYENSAKDPEAVKAAQAIKDILKPKRGWQGLIGKIHAGK
ncbi:MAG: tetratricopeptide repeat protein [Candidatus Omnitrophica bacterium]|nr:tetratricopeptide repeat protein [Candidatus Omnitrophota bacterium]